jgi:hypothetical protein
MRARGMSPYRDADNNAYSGPSHFTANERALTTVGRFVIILSAARTLRHSRPGCFSFAIPSSERPRVLTLSNAGLIKITQQDRAPQGCDLSGCVRRRAGRGRTPFSCRPQPSF